MPFLLALALVVGVWVASYFGVLALLIFPEHHCFFISAIQGDADLGVAEDWFHHEVEIHFHRGWRPVDWGVPPTTLGFYFARNMEYFQLIFPLWLPTLVLTGLCWFAWRKTRPMPVGRAFPVEPEKQEAETK